MAKSYKLNGSTAGSVAYAASVALLANDSVNVFAIDLTGACTVTVSEDSKAVVPGTKIILKASSDGTARDVTFGTGITAPVLEGVINKTKVQELVYDGSGWVACSAPVQID